MTRFRLAAAFVVGALGMFGAHAHGSQVMPRFVKSVPFQPGSDELGPRGEAAVTRAVKWTTGHKGWTALVAAHHCDADAAFAKKAPKPKADVDSKNVRETFVRDHERDSDAALIALARARATRLKNVLVARGLDPAKINTLGLGTDPECRGLVQFFLED